MPDAATTELPLRAERRPVALRAFVVRKKCQLVDASVTDLSYSGCRIEADETFVEGQRRELRVARRGIAQVEVRWAREGVAGARFIDR